MELPARSLGFPTHGLSRRGETREEIDGVGRKDEVGQMAQAVAVFRENALERIRLEQEADANRSLSEKERIARDEQKAKEAADTQFAVDNLANGLSRLSMAMSLIASASLSLPISIRFARTSTPLPKSFSLL